MAVPIDNAVAGRLALITGASGGIGGGCARALAELGLNLALHYSSSRDACEALAADLRQRYPALRVTTHRADMASAEQTGALCAQAAAAHGGQPVLVLVLNAGTGKKIPQINDITLADFEHTLQINLRAPFILTKSAVPGMQAARWGRVVSVGSIAASGAGVNGCHYAASKGGLRSMMQNLATRLGPAGITFNDVAPAMIAGTGMIPDEHAVPGVREQIPVGRLGGVDEVGEVVKMLVRTGYCTGQSILLAGGLPHQ